MGKNKNIYLTKVFTFAAAHKYGNAKWSDEKNLEVFGKDVRVHGHNYTLHVTVTHYTLHVTNYTLHITRPACQCGVC